MTQPLRLGRIKTCEAECASLIQAFLAAVHSAERAFAEYAWKAYARDWGATFGDTQLSTGAGFQALMSEGAKNYWCLRYQRDREQVLRYKAARYQLRRR